MSKLEKAATRIASDMINGYILAGVTDIDLGFIAEHACKLAYKISEIASGYKAEKEESSEKDIKKMVKHAVAEAVSKMPNDPKPHSQY